MADKPLSSTPFDQWPNAKKKGIMPTGFFGNVTADDVMSQESLLASEDQRFRSRNEDSLSKIKSIWETPSDEELRQKWEWGDPKNPKDVWGKDDKARTFARIVARNWALVEYSMDPSKTIDIPGSTKYSPQHARKGLYHYKSDTMAIARHDKAENADDSDVAWAATAYAHEAIHRSIERLRPELRAKGITLNSLEEEAFLSWFDRKYGPAPRQSFGVEEERNPQFNKAYQSLIRRYNPEDLLRTFNAIAQEKLTASTDPKTRGPR